MTDYLMAHLNRLTINQVALDLEDLKQTNRRTAGAVEDAFKDELEKVENKKPFKRKESDTQEQEKLAAIRNQKEAIRAQQAALALDLKRLEKEEAALIKKLEGVRGDSSLEDKLAEKRVKPSSPVLGESNARVGTSVRSDEAGPAPAASSSSSSFSAEPVSQVQPPMLMLSRMGQSVASGNASIPATLAAPAPPKKRLGVKVSGKKPL